MILLISTLQLLADYNNYSLKDFASVVASQNKINIVVDEELKEKFDFIITKKIQNYTNLDVFSELLDKKGLELQQRDNYYLIIRKEDKMVDKMHIYKTDHIDANLAAKKILPILSSFYKVKEQLNTKDNKKTSSIITTSSSDNNSTKEKKKDFSLNAIDHKTLVLTYKDDKINKYTKMILSSIDHIKKQLVIECKIYEVKTSALEEEGIKLQAIGETGGSILNLDVKLAGETTSAILNASTDPIKITSIIRLLNNKDNSHLLSTPKLTILEGSSGKVNEGETYPIKTQETTTTNSSTTNTVEKTENIDIGLVMQIEYQYEQKDYNYLKILLNKKDMISYNKDEKDIITTTRSIETDIRVLENQTMIIAGLGRQSTEKKKVEVPYLSQIPLLGELLKYKYDETKETTLVITLKARYEDNKKDLAKKL